jgi:sortase A
MGTTIPADAEAQAEAAAPAERARRTWVHRTGTALIGFGVLLVAYAAVVWFWGDPVTALYARYEQHQLAQSFDRELRAWPTAPAPPDPSAGIAHIRADARRDAASLRNSHPFGRLTIPRMGVSVIVVQGTDWLSDLSKGPGHYTQTTVPGLGRTVAIAGHRTTFGAWFRNIDSLRPGDPIILQMPYATFRYRVQFHRVVKSDDWSIIRQQGYDRLVLSACHPLYSASHRWVVFARAVSETPRGGDPIAITRTASATA